MADNEVTQLLDAIEDPVQRQDSDWLLERMQRITGKPARVWNRSMLGFGQYHYEYDSGRSGDFFLVGFAPRKGKLSIHVLPDLDRFGHHLDQLGKYKTGRSCLYVKRLDDIDRNRLEQLITESVSTMRSLYPEHR